MPRLLTTLRRWLAFAFLFAVLLLGTVAILLNTTVGSRFVVNRIAATVPGSLYVDGVDGTLWRTLSVRLLRYRNERIEIDADDLELTINWPSLFAGSVVLNDVSVGRIDSRSLTPPEEGPRPISVSMPPLPIALAIGNGRIDRFIFQRPAGDFVLTSIAWSAADFEGEQIQADEASFELNALAFSLAEVDTTLAGDVPVSANFEWMTTDGQWAGSGSLAGSLAEVSVSHTLSTPFEVATAGTVQLLNQVEPNFDLLSDVPVYEAGDVRIDNSRIGTVGTLDDYVATIAATVSEPRIPVSTIDGSASGSLYGLTGSNFNFQSDYGSAVATGSITWRPVLEVTLDINARDLDPSFIDESVPGDLEAGLRFSLSGSNDWHITGANVTGTLAGFDVTASGDLAAADQRILCSGCVTTFASSEEPDMRIRAGIEGSDQAFDIEIDGHYGNLSNIVAAGSVQRGPSGLSGTLSRASVNDDFTGRWVLSVPLSFRTGDVGVEVDAHRWLLPEGQIDITRVAFSPERVSIIGAASALPLAIANSFLPTGLCLDGTATANVDVTRESETWSGTADWRQSGTVLHVERTGESPFAVTAPVATANAVFSDDGAHVEATLRINPGVTISTTADIANLEQDPQVDAAIRIDGEDWQWLTALFPEIEDLEGVISADLTATGALQAPDVGGSASWMNGSANIPILNVPLRDVEVSLAMTPGGQNASITGTAIAGDGPVTLAGEVIDVLTPEPTFEFSLNGEVAELINWPEYHLWASPDLEVSGSLDGWDARGSLGIPRAEIDIRELPENAVTISEDARLADVDFSTSMSRARYSGEATVLLGEEVHVSAFGLDTRLEGELVVRKNPDRDLTLEGTVTLVDGEFEAYGQRLVIEEGTLTFTGPLDDPIVDVRATRMIEDLDNTIVAGLHLTGRAQNVSSTVYSEPAMSEADALSYLMIGRPLSEASASEGNELSDAAVRLGLRQAARITQQIGQSLGLDELTIIGDGGDATALVAGKQFNDRLYARYAYGVFSRLGMIMIRYRLSERLSLEAGAGETQSIDVLYTVEKE